MIVLLSSEIYVIYINMCSKFFIFVVLNIKVFTVFIRMITITLKKGALVKYRAFQLVNNTI